MAATFTAMALLPTGNPFEAKIKTKEKGTMSALSPFEAFEPNEAHHIAVMTDILRRKMEHDYPPGSTKRDAHPKHLGLVKAEFSIEPNLPPGLAVGVFATPRTFEAWVRFSSASGTVQSDAIKDSRGCALKLLGADGAHIGESDEATTQDFLLMNIPTMPLGTVKLFHDAIHYGVESSMLLFAAKLVLTGKASVLWALAQARITPTSPVDIRYWSTTPYLFGAHLTAKYSLVPTSTHKSEAPVKLSDNYLTDQLEKHLAEAEATFDFMVQINTDSTTMPVEDAAVEWKESKAPFVKVATLRIPKQAFRTTERNDLAEALSFSPAHALVEHRPIGGVNRARMIIYQALSDFRHQRDLRRKQP